MYDYIFFETLIIAQPPLFQIHYLPSSPGTDKPSVQLLLTFPSKGGHINLIKKCSFKYYNLGILLLDDENTNEVDSLEFKHNKDPERITTEIFNIWIRGDGLKPISWDALVQVLQNVDLHNLADELQGTLCS